MKRWTWVALLGFIAFSSSCGSLSLASGGSVSVTSTPTCLSGDCGTATALTDLIALPSATSSLTRTPSATRTPLPTATFTPSMTPIPSYAGVSVDSSVDFENYLPNQDFILHFDQAMDPDTTLPALLTYPYVDGRITWSADARGMTFRPVGGFDPSGTYLLQVNGSLRTAAGAAFDSKASWTIRVTDPPRLLSIAPHSGTLTVRRPTFTLDFSRRMDLVSLKAAVRFDGDIPFGMEVDGNQIRITVSKSLDPGQTVRLLLSGSAADSNGIPLGADQTWEYSLAPMVERIDFSPTPRQAVVIHFNYRMNAASVGLGIKITPPMPGKWTWTQQDSILRIEPNPPLLSGRTYTLSFSDPVKDSDGEPFPDAKQTIYTGLPFTVTTPKWNECDQPIQIKFDRAVDHHSVEKAIRSDPTAALSFSWNGNTLSILPSSGRWIDPAQILLAKTATDVQGAPFLDSDYSVQTQWYCSITQNTFGEEGDNIQVTDADGSRTVLLRYSEGDTFALYKLGINDFLKAYTAHPYREWGSGVEVDLAERAPLRSFAGEGNMVSVEDASFLRIPQDVPPGLYVLEALHDGNRDDTFVVLSRMTLVVKKSANQVWVSVRDINGEPTANAAIILYSGKQTVLGQGMTDRNGIFIYDHPVDDLAIVTASFNGDVSLSGVNSSWKHWTGIGVFPSDQLIVYAYTDRPIYKPGQNVFYKADLRNDNDVKFNLLPQNTSVRVRLLDPRENVLQTVNLATNGFGTINGSFALSEGAMLGTYTLEFLALGETHTRTFEVEDFTKPEFQLAVTPDTRTVISGQVLHLSVQASYFTGKPLEGAKVSWAVFSLFPVNHYYDEPQTSTDYYWNQIESSQNVGTTDSSGKTDLRLTIPSKNYYQLYWRSTGSAIGVEMTVSDGISDPVSTAVILTAYPSAEIVTADDGGFIHSLGNPLVVEAQVKNVLTGEPVSGRTVNAEVLRWSSDSVHSEWNDAYPAQSLETDDQGKIHAEIAISDPGFYEWKISGQDEMGNPFTWTDWVFFTSGDDPWQRYAGDVIRISADKDTYKPGDTAHLTILSSTRGTAIITFERGKVHNMRMISIQGPITKVDVPITSDFAPNIFVNAGMWDAQDPLLVQEEYYYANIPDSVYYSDTVELAVSIQHEELGVSIRSDKDEYTPGALADFQIKVTDDLGKPVSAELSLALVDEAIFALADDPAADIYQGFYSRRNLTVGTYDSFDTMRILFAGGRGGGGGSGSPTGLRSFFPDSAAWFPAVVTNGMGEAEVQIRLPDNLTSWRLTVRAITKDTKVGQAAYNVTTQKPLTIEPILPAVLTVGDTAVLSARITNNTEADLAVDAELTSALLIVDGGGPQTIDVAAGKSQVVEWRVTAAAAGEGMVIVRAAAGSLADGEQLPLEVRALATTQSASQSGSFTGDLRLSFFRPADALAGSQVRLKISRTAASDIMDGLDFLIGYPYGCVEQTMSRALPNAVVARAFRRLGLPFASQSELDSLLRIGVEKLYAFQHDDGGWGWWVDDSSDDYQTAWVVFGLSVMAEGGAEVDPAAIQRGVDYLKEALGDMDPRTRAFALYGMAVAGKGDADAELELAASPDALDDFSLAALALALEKTGQHAAAYAVLTDLSTVASSRGADVWWEEQDLDGEYHTKTMASSTRSTALILDAFLAIAPTATLASGTEIVPGAVAWLQQKRTSYGWGTTNETAFSILALSDYLIQAGASAPPAMVAVTVNGLPAGQYPLKGALSEMELTLPSASMTGGVNIVDLKTASGGRLYFLLDSAMELKQKAASASGILTVTRTYRDPVSGKILTLFAKGDVVRVTVSVSVPSAGSYFIVEDHLPGGLEPLNESLNTESRAALYGASKWSQYGYNYKEIHPDRVSFFITNVTAGVKTISYLARVTTEGEFYAPPALAYAMYRPELRGESAGSAFHAGPDVDGKTAWNGQVPSISEVLLSLLRRGPWSADRFTLEGLVIRLTYLWCPV